MIVSSCGSSPPLLTYSLVVFLSSAESYGASSFIESDEITDFSDFLPSISMLALKVGTFFQIDLCPFRTALAKRVDEIVLLLLSLTLLLLRESKVAARSLSFSGCL